MNFSRKLFSYIVGAIVILAILIFILKFAINLPYKSKIPDHPDLKNAPISLAEQITSVSRKVHNNPTADNLGMLGMIYHSSEYYVQAAQCYKLAVSRNKSKWIWSYYLGYLNNEMGESADAIENFREVIRINPEMYMAWYYVGECYENNGSASKAEVAFQKIINLQGKRTLPKTNTRNDYFPLRAYGMFQLSRIYYNSDRIDLAEETLKQILQFYRSYGPAYRLLGNVYSRKGDTIQSRKNILHANDLADFSQPVDTLIDKLALLSRSELYLLKQIDIAEKSIYPEWGLAMAKHGLKQLPDNKYLISKTIKLYLRLDSGKQALQLLDNHFRLYLEDFNELKDVADLLYEKGFYSQSLIYYNQSAKLKPEDIDIRESLAMCLWNTGLKTNAIGQISQFIDNNINNVNILISGVSFFIAAHDRTKAVNYLSILKRLSPTSPKVARLAGMIAENDGKIPEALAYYETSFRNDPEDLSTIRYLGNLLIKQKKWEKAIKHYRKALEFHPNEPELLGRIGSLLVSCPDVKLRDYNEGREFSERAFMHTGCPTEVIIAAAKSLSEAYSALGNKREAITYMNITISLAKNQNAPLEYIDELEKKLKQYSAAN